jgi:general secretion pathway protein K
MYKARKRLIGSTGGRRGIALIVVLFVIATLSVLVLEFVHSTRINMYIAGNIADGMKAFYLAQSSIYVAAAALLDDMQDDKEDHLEEDWAQSFPPLPGGEGWVTVEIFDESSKLNLNALVRKSGLPDAIKQEAFSNLLTSLELDPTLIDAIIDWTDEDDNAQNEGPEDAMYGLGVQDGGSYGIKNGKFLSLNELTLVPGITDEIYNKLTPYVTIYGDRKMNLNTVDQKVLSAFVSVLAGEDGSSNAAQEIVTWREIEGNHFKNKKVKSQLTGDVGIDSALAKKISDFFGVSSRYFSVKTEAIVAESTKKAYGIIQRTKAKVKVIYFRPS